MLLDQEWDTRTWNRAKVHGAIETLYSKVEHSEDAKRCELATTMLTRLLETHEGEEMLACIDAGGRQAGLTMRERGI